ncbi:sugar phosphate nucleotidyltransferase [Rhodoferax ferrireducens]|uniref:sugar phosphate nucleotidyltransferase n=1 Tax=Rhodoferax ferrireducens TaxID=192843 RepID=UPI00384C56C9
MTAENSQPMDKVTDAIHCGGFGNRLWPLSHAGLPKQFLVLSDTTSLFQQPIDFAEFKLRLN